MIGLVTCFEVYNYGSQLMSLALQMMMEELGYPCEQINYVPKRDLHYICSVPFKLTNQALIEHKRELKQKQNLVEQSSEQTRLFQKKKEAFDRFIKENMNLSKPAVGYRALTQLANQYDCVLLGSDQVWHPMNLEGDFKNLMFVPDRIPKISYGASFSVNDIPKNQIRRTKQYLNRIPYKSVREKQGADLIGELTGENVPVVLDPTLMTTMKQWKDKIDKKLVPGEPYIFTYFLGKDPANRKRVLELKKETGLKVAAIDLYNIENVNYIDWPVDCAGPGDFVGLIQGAKYICTDSFHGTVFSILNEKKFVTFLRYAGGATNAGNSRIGSLLEQLGLMNRIYADGAVQKQIDQGIDYVLVNEKLDTLRETSWTFLKNALKGFNL